MTHSSRTILRMLTSGKALMIITPVMIAGLIFGWFYIEMVRFNARCRHLEIEQQIQRLAIKKESVEDQEDAQTYEFPPFDVERWREILTTESLRYQRLIEENAVPVSLQVAFTKTPFANLDSKPFSLLGRFKEMQVPAVANSDWVRNPIDSFILQRMVADGHSPSPPAKKRELGRRIWYGLTGLPPSPEEIKKFLSDNDESLYESTVDGLLKSSRFGERWASVWLDLARYADSNGYEEDEFRPYAFPFRDFVIWAMNEDLQFDRFLQWQVAGDLMEPNNPLAVAATGFFTNAPLNTFFPQKSERYDELDDQVSTWGKSMLGLTVGCARCHDHFYDAMSQREYYRLVAIFKDTKREERYLTRDRGQEFLTVGGPLKKIKDEIDNILIAAIKDERINELDYTEEQKNLLRQEVDPDNKEQALLLSNCMRCLMVDAGDVGGDEEPLEKDRARYNELVSQRDKLEPLLLPLPPVGLTLSGNEISKMPILKTRKDNENGKLVGPGFISAVTVGLENRGDPWQDESWRNWNESGRESPRVALARWMTDIERGAGPVVARVIVNRLWQHHFGRGLVTTPSNFGAAGDEASHPELLDWLAAELVEHDWSLKHIHRLILTSATYQQSTQGSEFSIRNDPENELITRFPNQRLTAEMLRDGMLAASGLLNEKLYGPSVFHPIPKQSILRTQDSAEYTWPVDNTDKESHHRRTVYLVKKRTFSVPFVGMFDAPDGTFSCDSRTNTTTPTQSLTLMNSPLVQELADGMASRLTRQGWKSQREVVDSAFLLAFSRYPTETEVSASLDYLAASDSGEIDFDKLRGFCHVLFMANEFAYLN
jgi:hypothetical protein